MSVLRPTSPFKGLASFEDAELDAMLFFGRERERAVVTANLMGARMTILYGATGVGKSSLLRAGVAHGLRSVRDALVVVHDGWSGDPGRDLVDALRGEGMSLADAAADAAARVGGDVYIILDQFEEFFLYHDAEPFASELAAVVANSGLRANVLIGIRDDALARLDELKAAVPNPLANRLRLEHLDRRAGEAAIVGPIDAYNRLVESDARVEIEPGLVQAVLDQVAVARVGRGVDGGADGEGTGAIEAPYLQLVLERLWETELSRGSRRLRVQSLEELGGAAHIVERHLERAMAGLSAAQQDAAAAMYDHLVTPSGTKIALRASDLARYASLDETAARDVLDRLARERIVRGARDNGAAATRYEIYHDVLGDAVLSWRDRHEARKALRNEERRRKRAHRLAAMALVALAVVAAVAIFALVERNNAKRETRHARAGRLVAEARTDLEADPQRSIALALAAARGERTPQVENVLRDALIQSHVRLVVRAPSPVVAPGRGFFVVGDGDGRLQSFRDDGTVASRVDVGAPVTSVATSRDGSVAAGTRGGTIVAGGRGEYYSRQIAGVVTAVAIAGDQLAAGSGAGNVTLWSGHASRRLHVRGRITSLAFSPDRRLALVTSRDRRARLVDVRSGRVAHVLTQRGYVNTAAFDPGGRVVVTGSQDGSARLWSVRTGRALHDLGPAAGLGVTSTAFSPDGSLVAVASSDAVARVYDVRTGALRFYLSGDTNALTDIGFNPDGTALVTASADRTARIWTSDVGRQLAVLRGHRDAVTQAFFTSDVRRVVTAGADGTVRLWDPGTEAQLQVVVRSRLPFVDAVRRPDGAIAVTDSSGRTTVLDPSARRVVRVLRGASHHRAPAEATHGDLVARAGTDGSVTVTRGGRTIDRFAANADSLAFSPDGRLLAIGRRDRYLSVRDVASKRLLYSVIAHQGPVEAVSFSPDGRWVATGGPISVGVWHALTGRPLLLLRGPMKPVHAVLFTRDGQTIVAAGNDRTIRTYDCVVCGSLEQIRHAGEARLARTRPH
jgi:WD40 repeat protein